MKVGIVSYYFPPNNSSGAQRWSKMALYLKRRGFDVFVISSYGDRFGGEDHERYRYLREVVRVYPLRGSGKYGAPVANTYLRPMKFFVVPDSKIYFFAKYRKRIEEIIAGEMPEIVIITVPPFSSLLFLPTFFKKFGISYVVDMRDVWMYDPRRPNKIVDFVFEKRSLKGARGVLCINDYALDEAMKFNRNSKVVPHFYDPQEYRIEPIKHTDVWVSHIGSLFNERDVKFVKNVVDKLGVNLRLVGPGSERWGGLGPVSRRDAIREMVSADVLLAIFGRGRDQRFVSSVKLFEYMGSGKPVVVVSGDGYIRRVSEDLGLGVCGFSEEELYKRLKEALEGKYTPREPERFSIQSVGRDVENFLLSLL